MNVNLLKIVMFSMILGLSACESSTFYAMDEPVNDFSSIAPATGYQPQTFKDYLAIEYRNLADYEQNMMYDYKSAKHYIKKVEQLESGQMVGPDSLKTVNLSPEYRAELSLARETLINAITNYATPENRVPLAIAQTRYDCWLDQAAAFPEKPERLTCKRQFKENISAVQKPEIQNLEMYNFERI